MDLRPGFGEAGALLAKLRTKQYDRLDDGAATTAPTPAGHGLDMDL